MIVAIAVFDFHLPFSRGLKEKRAFLRPLKARLRSEFEISAAEVAHQDLLQRVVIGVAAVGPDREALEPLLQKVLGYVEHYAEENGAEIATERHEFLNYGDVGATGSAFGDAAGD
ncbi:MAG: DUF503 domain-containing protein [Thermoanaerobaculia bacterium]|jgi:uncharacterized protein YlxP (DUF503 family)